MKHFFTFLSGIIILFNLSAQLFEGSAFIKTPLIELGINNCGVFITDTIPPGFINEGSNDAFGEPGFYGFIVDYGYDGWGIGDPPYSGDFVSPGSAVEGWGIEFDGDLYRNSDTVCAINEFPGNIIDYIETPDSISVIWEGVVSDVTVRQTTTAYSSGLFFITSILVINNSPDSLHNLYYFRNMDPDNEQIWTADFTTIQEVDNDSNYVTAIGLEYGLYLALVSGDALAQGSFGNFNTTDAISISDVFNGTGGYNTTGNEVADMSMQLSFYRPYISPGDTARFAFGHVFARDQVDNVYAKTINDSVDIECVFETTIDVTDITYTSAGCNWTDAPAHEYELIITNTETGEINTFTTFGSTYNFTGLDSCTLYEVILITSCEGESIISDTAEFITECADTTLTIANLSQPYFTIHPNPAFEFISLEFQYQLPGPIQIKLFNVLGEIVYEKKLIDPDKTTTGGTANKTEIQQSALNASDPRN
ncbi:MAG: hypothetical protein ACHQFW_11345, partial [Chitinophagales bacterium]